MTTSPLNVNEVSQLLAACEKGAVVYLIGAGGCGVSGLGHLFLDLGFQVAGSDVASSEAVTLLRAQGAVIYSEHSDEWVRKHRPVLVIYSSAIRPDNPELQAAIELGIPLARRATALSALVSRQKGICVAGMHGKTTTSALIAFALDRLGQSPSYAVGGLIPQLPRHARLNSSASVANPWFIVETDESDGTLKEFHPECAILLNVDQEHLDYFSDFESIVREFQRFASQTRGTVVYCADDIRLGALLQDRPASVSYGFHSRADYRVEIKSQEMRSAGSGIFPLSHFEVWHQGERLGSFSIQLIGEQNISNASAAIALLHQIGFSPMEIAQAISTFQGAARRQQELYRDSVCRIFDDYGHHPTEIRATLQAFKTLAPRRLLVAFQPHRFTRTQHLLNEFATCFRGADQLFLTDIYAASEQAIDGICGEKLADAVRAQGQEVTYVPTVQQVCQTVSEAMQPGDLVLFLGAGDITKAAHQLARQKKEETANARIILYEELTKRLSPESVVRRDELLAKRTTLRVGGRADFYVEPCSEEDLAQVLRFCSIHRLPVMLLGRGSNLLVQDGGIRGVVICLSQPRFAQIEVRGDEIYCGAGARLKGVSQEAKRQGLSGFEFLEGIPGSVGGALRMNAGAMGGNMFKIVKSVRYMDSEGNIHEQDVNDVKVEYRSCPIFKTHVALSAILKGEPAPKEEIAERMNACSQKRWGSQPAAPSAGCVFKNPPTVPAGKLIDELGLKGMRVGGAMVSDVHGNFIVNDGNATAQDVLRLIEIIRQRARVLRGITLETEVEIVGETVDYGT